MDVWGAGARTRTCVDPYLVGSAKSRLEGCGPKIGPDSN
jgi:hypothetical protein